MEITFNLESNPDVGFYALYASLKIFSDKKAEESGLNRMSLPGAEAYSMLQELKEKYPDKFKESEEEYESERFKKWLISYPGCTIESYEKLNSTLKSEIIQIYNNTRKL